MCNKFNFVLQRDESIRILAPDTKLNGGREVTFNEFASNKDRHLSYLKEQVADWIDALSPYGHHLKDIEYGEEEDSDSDCRRVDAATVCHKNLVDSSEEVAMASTTAEFNFPV